MKEPVLFNWATEQIRKDKEERVEFVDSILKLLYPWLNPSLYLDCKKKEQKEKNKILSLAKTDDIKKVETINSFDVFMKNMGIDLSKKDD